MNLIAVRRDDRFSPNSVEKDRLILEAACIMLCSSYEQQGEPAAYRWVDEAELTAADEADIYLSMARLPETLNILEGFERQGRRVVNGVQGVRNCQRSKLEQLMRANHVAMPAEIFVDANDLQHGVWLKRGDVAAQSKEDVVFCKDGETLRKAISAFESRGICDYVVSRHVEGDVVKFYTIPKGNITWNFHNKGDAATEKRITDAVNAACNYFNNMTSVVKTFDVTYSAGTQTADCNYQAQPWMNVGPNTSYQRCGTIMHEMEHGLGVIPYSTQWYYQVLRENVDGSGRGTGHWLGDRVTEALSFWDNVAFEQLNGDYQHMWPYGINGAHEDTGAETLYLGNAMICQALGEDGLEHTNNHFADPYYAIDVEEGVKYYLKNEDESRGFYTSYLVEQPNGSLAWKEVAIDQLASTDEAAWYVTFTPDNQFYQFRNAATGHYLNLAGQTANTATSLSGNTDFHLMKARVDAVDTHTEAPNPRGYWLLHHAARNPRGLSAAANGAVATEVLNLRNTSTTQRWLILTAEQAADVDRVGLSAFKAEINDILSQLYELRDVPHTEDEEGTDQALNDAISEIEAGASDAKSAVEVAALMEKARQAEFNFLANATPSDIEHPFNVSLLISNPGMDDSKGWSSAPTMNYSCAEFYEVTFDFNQTIENLPAGTYMLCAQGFQRPGKVEIAYQNRNSTTRVNAYLYAGTKSTRLKNIS